MALSLLSMFIHCLYYTESLFVRKQYYLAMIASWVLKMEIINSMFLKKIYVPGIFSPCANNEGQGPAQHSLCKS